MRFSWVSRSQVVLCVSFLWLLPIAITGYVVGGGPGSPLHPGDPTNTLYFDSERLSSLTSDILVFLGIVVTILISVFTGVYTNARDHRNDGYRTLNRAAADLSLVGNRMRVNAPLAGIPLGGQLTQFANETNDIAARLSAIPPTWGGYEADRQLESDLMNYVNSRGQLILLAGAWLSADAIWSTLWQETDTYVRNVLIGALEIEEGIVGERFASWLLRITISMSGLLSIVLVVRLSSAIGYGVPASAWSNAFVGIGLSLVALLHFLAFIPLVILWQVEWNRRVSQWQADAA